MNSGNFQSVSLGFINSHSKGKLEGKLQALELEWQI
jgi:hypothetical protein